MRHQCRVPKLGRPADQRKAMLRALTTQLIREGRVTTTKARAKALRDEAERIRGRVQNCCLKPQPLAEQLRVIWDHERERHAAV